MHQKIVRIGVLAAYFLLSSILVQSVELQAQTERQSLGLFGCSVTDIASDNYSSLVIASCDGPKGVYASTNFGQSWSYAEGGNYLSGAVSAAVINGSKAFIMKGGSSFSGTTKILMSAVDSNSLAFSWTELTTTATTIYRRPGLQTAGSVVLFGALEGSNPLIISINAGTGEQIADNYLDDPTHKLRSMAITNSRAFIITENRTSSSSRKLYAADFDSDTGVISNWTNITAAANAARTGNAAAAIPSEVYLGPSDSVWVRMEDYPNAQILRSTNSGTSFVAMLPNGLAGFPNDTKYSPHDDFGRHKGCFQGNSFIIENFVSVDGGNTWAKFMDSITDNFNLFDYDLCLFDASDSTNNRALIRRVNGLDFSNDVTSGASLLRTDSNTGIEGIIVKGLSRATDDPNTTALVTNAGIAVTNNFTSTDRVWTFPTCNSQKSCWGNNIEIDKNNPLIVYSGTGAVDRGVITSNAPGDVTVDWTTLTTDPNNSIAWDDLKIVTSDLYPGEVFVIYRDIYQADGSSPWEKKGGVFVYNSSTGALLRSSLADHPVFDLIIIDADSMFASVDYLDSNLVGDTSTKGLYHSSDGGASWTRLSTEPIAILTYDSTRDILYGSTALGATPFTGVFKLEKASEEPEELVKVSEDSGFFLDLEVDLSTGDLYASKDNLILRSTDQGETWNNHYEGLTDESFFVLDMVEVDVTASSATQSKDAAYISSETSLVGGSSIGLGKIASTKEECSLKLKNLNCSGKQSPNTSCSFQIAAKKADGKALKNKVVTLQRKIKSTNTWKKVSKQKVTGNKITMTVSVPKTTQYRARIENKNYSCVSPTRKVRIQ